MAVGGHLVHLLAAQRCLYEALDSAGGTDPRWEAPGDWMALRAGRSGWSNRLGWDKGWHLLLAVHPVEVRTSFAFNPASTKDEPLADPFLAVRRYPHPRLPSVGAPARGLSRL
jgi:hypothetical protein